MNNRVILSLVAFFIACSTWTVQAQKNKEVNMKTSKILVAYFSVTGTTENVAKILQKLQMANYIRLFHQRVIQMLTLTGIIKNHAVLWK